MKAAVSNKELDDKRKSKLSLLKIKISKVEPWLAPVLIFVLAFVLRALYVGVFLEHRIAHFGDAYNFLRSGTCLLEAILSSQNIFVFLSKVYHVPESQVQLLQSMTSLKLTDRLLIDGPIFPAYLALAEWISGVNAYNPIFEAYSVSLCLCNSLLDSITCVLIYFSGRLAFTRRAGLIAGLLFVIYPAAIINTQHCYSEPFSYFLLSTWTALALLVLLRHQKNKFLNMAAWWALGLSTGLLMLSKPAFILLAPLALMVIIPISIFRQIHYRNKNQSLISSILPLLSKFASRAAISAIGLALILTPWVFFNKAASGQYSVFVNRVPAFNIFHGNQIRTDAWRCYPFYGTFPGDNKLVIVSLLKEAQKEPLSFIGLQFKKIARLWSGVWNEYHYVIFGIPLKIQSLIHQLLLLSATISLSHLILRSKHKTLSRSFSASVLFGTIALFHFAYVPFEAISRYAITAMPAIVLLSAHIITESSRSIKSARASLIILFVTAATCFLIISESANLANLFASILPSKLLDWAPRFAVFVDCFCFFICFVPIYNLFNIILPDKTNRLSYLVIPGAFALLSCLVATFYTIDSFDWSEWSCNLNSKQRVRQTIQLPKTILCAGTAFVLFDMGADNLAPPVTILLNNEQLYENPIPLAQLQPNNSDILQCLAIQAEGMSLDLRSFRNWWVVPFNKSILVPGQKNVIEIYCKDDSAHTIIYGDFHKPAILDEKTDGSRYLPSLRSFSYTKGFTTFDHRDSRVFEKVEIRGKTIESSRKTIQNHTTDLSDSFGSQYGNYRIRLLIPRDNSTYTNKNSLLASTNELAAKSFQTKPLESTSSVPKIQETILVGEKAQLVNGENPTSFVPARAVIKLPSDLALGTRIYFTCQIKSIKGNHPCFVKLAFTGTDKNKKIHVWNSIWQPIGIPVSKEFKETTFNDFIPDHILRLDNLEIRPLFSPCLPDLVFLKRKQAIKNSIEIKNAKLFLLNPLDLPPLEKRAWSIY